MRSAPRVGQTVRLSPSGRGANIFLGDVWAWRGQIVGLTRKPHLVRIRRVAPTPIKSVYTFHVDFLEAAK